MHSIQVRFLFLLLFPLLQFHLSFATKDCPSGWTKWNKKCFYSNDTSFEFEQNMQACERLGGTAVSIHSEEENNFIGEHVLKADVYYCLGLRQVQYGVDSFAWADGSMFDYNNWGAGKPPGLKTRCFSSEIRNKLWYGFACTSSCRLFCQMQLDGQENPSPSNRVVDQIVVEQLSLKKAVSKVETQLEEVTKSVSGLTTKLNELPAMEPIQRQIQDTQQMVQQKAAQLASDIKLAQNQVNDNLNKEKADVMREITAVNRSVISEVAQCRQYVDRKGQENVAFLQKLVSDKENSINSLVNQAAVKADQISQRLSTFETSNENYKRTVDTLVTKSQQHDDRITQIQNDAGTALSRSKTVEDETRNSIQVVRSDLEKIAKNYQNLENTMKSSLSNISAETSQKLVETTNKITRNSAEVGNVIRKLVTLERTFNQTIKDLKDYNPSSGQAENILQLKMELNQKEKDLQEQIDANSKKDAETMQKVSSLVSTVESLRQSLLNATSQLIPNLEDKLSSTKKELHNFNEKLQKIFSELTDESYRHIQTDKSLKSLQMVLQSLEQKVDLVQNKTIEMVNKKVSGKNIVHKEELEQEHYRALFFNGVTVLASFVLFTLVLAVYVACRNRNDRKATQLRNQSYEVFETQLHTLLK